MQAIINAPKWLPNSKAPSQNKAAVNTNLPSSARYIAPRISAGFRRRARGYTLTANHAVGATATPPPNKAATAVSRSRIPHATKAATTAVAICAPSSVHANDLPRKRIRRLLPGGPSTAREVDLVLAARPNPASPVFRQIHPDPPRAPTMTSCARRRPRPSLAMARQPDQASGSPRGGKPHPRARQLVRSACTALNCISAAFAAAIQPERSRPLGPLRCPGEEGSAAASQARDVPAMGWARGRSPQAVCEYAPSREPIAAAA